MMEAGLSRGDLVVVTGAAQGIGRAIAHRLAQRGARLALWDIQEEGLRNTIEECRDLGCEAHAFVVDLADRDMIETSGRAVIESLGDPFGLVNNSAIFPRSFIFDLDLDEWDKVLSINLTGPFVCCKLFGPAMMRAGRGAIVNIGSNVVFRGDPNGAHYAAAKAGILGLTKSLSLAMAPAQIRVNCVIPGLTDTAQPLAAMTRDQLMEKGKDIPFGRVGQPDEVAGLVEFLFSADAAYISGQSISVNGGAVAVP
jgi:NAD(P)-dependent dehydrogenase (short-subunit alcohol dehydrogenase family)